MADEQWTVVIGNLTADPELRFTPSGAAVANFTVAKTPRTFDKNSNEWRDEETLFFRCSVWREQAENFAESVTKGMKVIAYGKLKARSYDGKDGNRQTVWELECEDVGPSMRKIRGKLEKVGGTGNSYGSGGGFGGSQGGGGQRGGGAPSQGGQRGGGGAPQGGRQEVWDQGSAAPSYDWNQQAGGDEPPF